MDEDGVKVVAAVVLLRFELLESMESEKEDFKDDVEREGLGDAVWRRRNSWIAFSNSRVVKFVSVVMIRACDMGN